MNIPKNEEKQLINNSIEIFGWIGAFLVVGAYFLVQMHYLTPKSLSYILLNLMGATLLLIHSYKNKVYQFVLINLVWISIAVLGIFTFKS